MATVGGYGDTLPLIPLGVALQQAGHAVTLVCVSFVAGVVYSYGLNPLPYHWETAEVLGHVLMKAWEGGDHHAQMEVIST
jgi:UDP:flavonoid glycosyltransferase YjiC (YdhE family)